MILKSTQPLTEMSTRDIFLEGKGGRCVGPILPYICAGFLEILRAITSWSPNDMSRAVMDFAVPYKLFELATP